MKILTVSEYLKQQYGQKIYKLSLSSGCTCPNRDGTLNYGGCTFCSEGGSGEFAQVIRDPEEIDTEIEKARQRVLAKLPEINRRTGRNSLRTFNPSRTHMERLGG